MTRINIIDPRVLTNQHLLAEYKELPRIFTAVRKLYESGKTIEDVDIPEEYVLGKGHCKFFYNKLLWLLTRYGALIIELKIRGFKLDSEKYNKITTSAIELFTDAQDNELSNLLMSYKPTPEEMYKNMYRISVRHFKIKDGVFE